MTISTSSSVVIGIGNGTTSTFDFDFVMGSTSNAVVTYVNSSGQSTILTSSQYTIFLNPAASGALWGVGGTVTYSVSSPIPSGSLLIIGRIVPLTQVTTISNQGGNYQQAIEIALDTLEMQIQQIANGQNSLFVTTSQTSNTVGLGQLTFTVAASNLAFAPGQFLIASANGSPNNFVFGQVISYTNFILVLNALTTGGAGTFTNWNIAISGVEGPIVSGTVTSSSSSSTIGDLVTWSNIVGSAIQESANGNLSGYLTIPTQTANSKNTRAATTAYVDRTLTSISALTFGAVGDNSTDNTAAGNAAVAYINATGGYVYWPQGSYVFNSALNSITSLSGGFIGAGRGNNSTISQTLTLPYGTVFRCNFASGALIINNASANFYMADICFWPIAYRSTEEILIEGNASNSVFERLNFVFCWRAFNIPVSAVMIIRDIYFFSLFGPQDVLVGGSTNGGITALGAQATLLINNVHYTAWQGAVPSFSGAGKVYNSWTTSRTQALYDLTINNGYVWQCAQAGTTASSGSGPTIPTYTHATGVGSPLATQITDGTVKWVMITSGNHAGVTIDSYSVGTWLDNVELTAGVNGLHMTDTVAASGSAPTYTWLKACLANELMGAGYAFDGGGIVEMDGCVGNFCISSAGVTVGASAAFKGDLSILGGRYSQNGTQGIFIGGSGTNGIKINNARVAANSQLSAGTYDDIAFNGTITDFDVQGCSFTVWDNTNTVANAISINGASSNRFIIMGNRTGGNAITNAAGTSATKIVANNT